MWTKYCVSFSSAQPAPEQVKVVLPTTGVPDRVASAVVVLGLPLDSRARRVTVILPALSIWSKFSVTLERV